MGSSYEEKEEEEGGGEWGVWLVNGFWQTQGGIFSVLDRADSGFPLETQIDIHAPTLPEGTVKKERS